MAGWINLYRNLKQCKKLTERINKPEQLNVSGIFCIEYICELNSTNKTKGLLFFKKEAEKKEIVDFFFKRGFQISCWTK